MKAKSFDVCKCGDYRDQHVMISIPSKVHQDARVLVEGQCELKECPCTRFRLGMQARIIWERP